MTSKTQGVVAVLLAAVLVRLSWTGEYLRFVLPWMRWPLLVAGAVLLLLAIPPALGLRNTSERMPWTTWLMLLPAVIVFAVAPPPLGAFLAERRATQAPPPYSGPALLPASSDGGPVDLAVDEFTWGAAQADDAMGLAGRTVRMDGFVSMDPHGDWYLTRLVIFCCAADAIVERVKVLGPPAPPRDQWVRITGTWVEGTGSDPDNPAEISATEVVRIPTPKDPY